MDIEQDDAAMEMLQRLRNRGYTADDVRRALDREAKGACKHEGYSFAKHGRCCPHWWRVPVRSWRLK